MWENFVFIFIFEVVYGWFISLLPLIVLDNLFQLNRWSPKELRLCHKLWFSNPYIITTKCRRPFIFQTVNYVKPNNWSLKFHKFTPTGCKYIRIRTFEFVAKTQFLQCHNSQDWIWIMYIWLKITNLARQIMSIKWLVLKICKNRI